MSASRMIPSLQITKRLFGTSKTTSLPMKPGTVLKPLGIFKGEDPPVVKERSEYPDWVNDLAKPLPGLAVLRKIPNEQAEEKDIMRYLKLNRRQQIREQNEQAAI